MLTTSILLYFVVLLVLYYTYLIKKWRNPKCKGVLPPGSMGLPIIGETLQLFIPSYSLDIHPFIRQRLERYGPIFRSNLVGRPIVISADTEFNYFILTQEGRLAELWYLDTFSKFLSLEGESSINVAGYLHKYTRGALLCHLGYESLREKWLSQIQNLVEETLQSWAKQDIVDVKHALFPIFYDFTAKILCGYDAKTSPDKLSESFTTHVSGLMSFPLNIPGTSHHKCLKSKEKVMNILKKLVKEKRKSDEKNGEDFVNAALNNMDKEKFLTEDFITNVLFAILFAGSESISTIVTLMLKLLSSSSPSVIEELTAEHESIFQNRHGLDSSIKWEDYKSMTFTHQVINETLRLGNFVPGLLRKAIKDIQYKGYTIPAGWAIMMVPFSLHVNPEIYKDPLVFNPFRWKDLDSYIISKNFTPFGGGTRQCIGAEYTKVMAAIFLHVLATKYRWTIIKEGKVGRNPLLGFGDGLHIKFSALASLA